MILPFFVLSCILGADAKSDSLRSRAAALSIEQSRLDLAKDLVAELRQDSWEARYLRGELSRALSWSDPQVVGVLSGPLGLDAVHLGAGGTLRYHDLATTRRSGWRKVTAGAIKWAVLDPPGERVVVCDGETRVIANVNSEISALIEVDGDLGSRSVAFAETVGRIVVLSAGEVRIYGDAGALRARIPVLEGAQALSISASGEFLALEYGRKVRVLNCETREYFDLPGSRALFLGGGHDVFVWEMPGISLYSLKESKYVWRHPGKFGLFASQEDSIGDKVCFIISGVLILVDARSGAEYAEIQSVRGTEYDSAQFLANGDLVAAETIHGAIEIWDPLQKRLHGEFFVGQQPGQMPWSAASSGYNIWSIGPGGRGSRVRDDRGVGVTRNLGGQAIYTAQRRANSLRQRVRGLDLTEDATRLLATVGERVLLVDTASGSPTWELALGQDVIAGILDCAGRCVLLLADGTIASVSSDGVEKLGKTTVQNPTYVSQLDDDSFAVGGESRFEEFSLSTLEKRASHEARGKLVSTQQGLLSRTRDGLELISKRENPALLELLSGPEYFSVAADETASPALYVLSGAKHLAFGINDEFKRLPQFPGEVLAVTVSRSHKRIAVGYYGENERGEVGSTIRIFDFDGNVCLELDAGRCVVSRLRLGSSKEGCLIAFSENSGVLLWRPRELEGN